MRKTYFAGIIAVMGAMTLHSAIATTIELEPVADVGFLYSSTPPVRQNLLNAGVGSIGASLHSGASGRGAAALLRFDLSKIPAGAIVESVELVLNPLYSYSSSVYEANEALLVYQLAGENAEWVEGSGTSLEDPESGEVTVPGANGSYVNMESYEDDATHDGVRWLSGNTIGPMDFSGDPLGTMELSELGMVQNQTIVIDLAPAAIQAWLRDSNLAQAGLVLWMRSEEMQVSKSRFAIFDSREGEVPPRLIIRYTNK